MSDQEQQNQFKAMIKAVYDDGEAEINGRKYQFTKMVHKERRKVFAFYTKVAQEIALQNFWFLESPDFESVESIIYSRVLFEGSALSKLGDAHWDKYPDDYLTLISIALAVISYPFLPAGAMS